MKKKLILMCILIISFFTLAFVTLNGYLTSFDKNVYNCIFNLFGEKFLDFFLVITHLGGIVGIFTIVISLFIKFFKTKEMNLMLFNLFFCIIFNNILKLIFTRNRPFSLMKIEEFGYSFPSGHAMVSMAFYGLIIYYIFKCNKSKLFKILSSIFFIFVILTVGVSRIYLGVHFPTDIIGGYLFGIINIILSISVFDKFFRKELK